MSKILLIHSFNIIQDTPVFNAVSYYRMNKPHEVLSRLYPEFEITHSLPADEYPDELLSTFNLVIFCRQIDKSKGIIEQLNRLDIPFGLDLDDYWILNEDHILYEHYEKNNISQLVIDSIKAAHFITCTTEVLATKIKEHNKNVYIIENGIDTDDGNWQINRVNSKRTRFGFTQGTTHVPDIFSICHSVQQSLSDDQFQKQGQILLTGFDFGTTEMDAVKLYERMLTNELKTITDLKYRKQLKEVRNPNAINQPYRRVSALPVYSFAKIYNDIDVCVSPLIDSIFNSCKSELKMIEAGFKGCAFMGSNVPAYSHLMTKDNSFDLNEQPFYEWSKYILNNPNIVKDKSAQLSLDIQKYSLNLLTDKRKELYERFK